MNSTELSHLLFVDHVGVRRGGRVGVAVLVGSKRGQSGVEAGGWWFCGCCDGGSVDGIKGGGISTQNK